MNAIVTVIQVVAYPLNQLLIDGFPSIATQLTNTADFLTQHLQALPYVLTFFPPGVVALLMFMLGVELLLMNVWQSSFFITKIWTIVQKIKFW